jgi:hypothetical protein
MKGMRHKDQINRLGPQARDIVSIGSNKAAVHHACFLQAHPRNVQQCRIDVDRRDVARDLCDLQSEPAIARAQIDRLHARLQANAREHAGRIGPQCLPPAGGRHFRPFKESRFVRHVTDLFHNGAH